MSGEGRFAGQPFKLAGAFGVPSRPDDRVSLPVDLTAQAVAGQAIRGAGKAAPAVSGSLALKGKVALNALRFGGLDAAASMRTPALADCGQC